MKSKNTEIKVSLGFFRDMPEDIIRIFPEYLGKDLVTFGSTCKWFNGFFNNPNFQSQHWQQKQQAVREENYRMQITPAFSIFNKYLKKIPCTPLIDLKKAFHVLPGNHQLSFLKKLNPLEREEILKWALENREFWVAEFLFPLVTFQTGKKALKLFFFTNQEDVARFFDLLANINISEKKFIFLDMLSKRTFALEALEYFFKVLDNMGIKQEILKGNSDMLLRQFLTGFTKRKGRVEKMRYLLNVLGKEGKQALQRNGAQIFKESLCYRSLEELKYLLNEQLGEKKQKLLKENTFELLNGAISEGYAENLKYLLEELTPKIKQEVLGERNSFLLLRSALMSRDAIEGLKVVLGELDNIGIKQEVLKKYAFKLLKFAATMCTPQEVKFLLEQLEIAGIKQAVFKENGLKLLEVKPLESTSPEITTCFLKALEKGVKEELLKKEAHKFFIHAIWRRNDGLLHYLLEELDKIGVKQKILKELLSQEETFNKMTRYHHKWGLSTLEHLIEQLENTEKEEVFKKWGHMFLFLAIQSGTLNKLKDFVRRLDFIGKKQEALICLLQPIGERCLLQEIVSINTMIEILEGSECFQYLLQELDNMGLKQKALEAIIFNKKFFTGTEIYSPITTKVVHLESLKYLFKHINQTTEQRYTLLCDFLKLEEKEASFLKLEEKEASSNKSLMELMAYLFINPPELDFLSNKKFLTSFDRTYISTWYQEYQAELKYSFDAMIERIGLEQYENSYRVKYTELAKDKESQLFTYLLRKTLKEWFDDKLYNNHPAIIPIRIQGSYDQWESVIIEILNKEHDLEAVLAVLDDLLIEHITCESESLLSDSLKRVYSKWGEEILSYSF